MFSFLVAWVCAAVAINVCVRILFKTTPRRMLYDSLTRTNHSYDYLNGYLIGITNIKMYYYIVGDIPSSNWLDDNKFNLLNDRPKLVKTLNDDIKRGAGILDI
jgi:hypothetical protein